MPYKDPEKRKAAQRKANQKWRASHQDSIKASRAAYRASPEGKAVTAAYNARPEVRARDRARDATNKERRDRRRALDMARHPERFRKAYDPNCRPFPATYDPDVGEWVRCERTLLRASDASLAAHAAAALIVIDERLAGEACR